MTNPNQSDLDVFVDISVHLSGFSRIELEATGMVDTYYDTITANTDSTIVDLFTKEARRILRLNDEAEITDAIAARLIPDGNYRGLAKNIILMWYLGTWEGNVISANSYTQGLVWEASETHPPGAKQPGFDSWANPPIKING